MAEKFTESLDEKRENKLITQNEYDVLMEFYKKDFEEKQSFNRVMETFALQKEENQIVTGCVSFIKLVSTLNGTWSITEPEFLITDSNHHLMYKIYQEGRYTGMQYGFAFTREDFSFEYQCCEVVDEEVYNRNDFDVYAGILIKAGAFNISDENALNILMNSKDDGTVADQWAYSCKEKPSDVLYMFRID